MGGAVALAIVAFVTPATANPLNRYIGTWTGSGSVKLDSGKSESISCKAYYTSPNGGSQLNVAIRCANPSNKIEMRADLIYSGGSVSGTWEERTFNATGAVSGTASEASLKLSINGAINGSMSVSLNNNRQNVNISTAGSGSGLSGVKISLKRQG
jgi:hypothetical protein